MDNTTYWLVTVAVWLLLSAVFYISCCADPDDGSLAGRANRCLCAWFMPQIDALMRKVCGRRLHRGVHRALHWVIYEPNPLVQLFYLAIFTGGMVAFEMGTVPLLGNLYVAAYHRVGVWVGVALCLWIFWLCSTSDAGVITPATYKRFAASYAHDDVMYRRVTCRTCKHVKPARSKHCSVYNKCVARFDHYCIWINNDVGALNYRWFLLFLLLHSAFLLYVFAVVGGTLVAIPVQYDFFNSTYVDSSGERVPVDLYFTTMVLLHDFPLVFGLAIFVFFLFLTVGGFLLYHLVLVRANQTTNERFKWEETKAVVEHLFAMRDAKHPLTPQATEVLRAVKLNARGEFVYPYDLGSFWKHMGEVVWPRARRARVGGDGEDSAKAKAE